MEGKSDFDIESDDSDDFPDIFETDSKEAKEPSEICAGDIVWAEFRNLHWPALVRRVIKRERKVVVWYLDSPGISFKVSRTKILSFKNPEVNQRITQQASESPMKEKHDKVLSSTLTYIRRRALGCNDDPGKFFDCNIPYLSFKNFKNDCNSNRSVQSNNKSLFLESIENHNDDSGSEITVESDDDESKISERFSGILNGSDDVTYDKERVDAIVSCIKAGRTDKHLIAVQGGKVPSEFQQLYEDAMQTDLKKLWHDSKTSELCGIVKKQDRLVEISTYLMNLYEKTVEGGKCVIYRYVTSVWLPESIAKAIAILDEKPETLDSSASSVSLDNIPVQEKSNKCKSIKSNPPVRKSKRKINKKSSGAKLPSIPSKKANMSKIKVVKPSKNARKSVSKRRK